MDLLRFITAGNVDDGKSTLIGRLLYDSKSILKDQYDAIEKASQSRGDDYVNLALLTDGLKSEREQGITIDVAYRYFATTKRKFIIADCPGHVEYTRNMVTGASTANLAVILIDARAGLTEQTKRHAFIASLIQIPHLIIAINKMDLINYSQAQFDKIRNDFEDFAGKLEVHDIKFIPLSALQGDNIVNKSESMPWYKGPSLLQWLEDVYIASDANLIDFRFPIQSVIRPQSKTTLDYRGYAGTVASGGVKIGDEIIVLPTGMPSKIKSIEIYDKKLNEAKALMAVTLRLEDEVDADRGYMIVRPNNQPTVAQDLDVMICWMTHAPLKEGQRFLLIHTTQQAKCFVKKILYKINVHTLNRAEATELKLNDLGRITIRTSQPLFIDAYKKNRATGNLILIDELTHNTVGACMIL